MNTVDIVLAILLLIAIGLGLRKGFILQLASLVALVLGIFGAVKLTDSAVELFNSSTQAEIEHISLIMFCVVFILIVVLVHIGAHLLEKALKLVALNWANRIAGGIFSMMKWALIISVLISTGEKFALFAASETPEKYQESVLYNPIKLMGGFILPPLKTFYEESLNMWEKANKETPLEETPSHE